MPLGSAAASDANDANDANAYAVGGAETTATGSLAATLADVGRLLERASTGDPARRGSTRLELAPGSPLEILRVRFGLSDFEAGVVALALSVELLPGLDRKFAALDPEPGATDRPYPTFARALALLDGGHWDALSPAGPLRQRRLIALGDGDVLTERPIRIEERILHALMGVDRLDARVSRRVRPLAPALTLPPSHEQASANLASMLLVNPGMPVYVASELTTDALAVIARAGQRAFSAVYVIDGAMLPTDAADRDELLQMWHREATLQDLLLAIDLEGCTERASERLALDFALRAETPTVMAGRDALSPVDRPIPRIEIPPATFAERLDLWNEALAELPRPTPGEVASLAAHFRGDVGLVRGAADKLRAAVRAEQEGRGPDQHGDLQKHDAGTGDSDGNGARARPGAFLWQACRTQARPRMGALAQRAHGNLRLDDVVLPEVQRRLLDALVSQVLHKATVQYAWGFGAGEARGHGVSAVFAGPSGTGKTMAAEAIAAALGLDLYRVDLSAVVSKYIGETEQNLRRVFDAAEAGSAVLLFDEADALFGKRTEVKDSHDRHANIEVSYLLQRMEAYGGLAILTTNLRKNIDDAFFRRIPFVVDFPFPDVALRERIWRGIFPAQAPLLGVDFARLARLSLAGGNVRSIARNAAYLAAATGGPITMKGLLEATRMEYAKLGHSLPSEEIRGWV